MKKATNMTATIQTLFLAWLSITTVNPAAAQDVMDAELSEDLMFADGKLVTQADETAGDTSSALLAAETVKVGGSFTMDMEGSGNPDLWGDELSSYIEPSIDLSVDLYVDARPDEDLRVFVKGRLEYPFTGSGDFAIREAFVDTVPIPGVFVRSGKQTANWGVGYFFSPANLLNTQRVDPEDPEAELVGPLAMKVHLPIGTDNYYLYAMLDEAADGGPVGLAPKAEWVIGNAEFSLGGLWMPDSPWAAMATISASIGVVDVFGEAVVRGDEDKHWVILDSASPSGIAVTTKPEDLFPLATAGVSWSRTDELNRADIAIRTQYYYNGLGYEDPLILSGHGPAVQSLVVSEALSPEDLMERARHYFGAMVSVTGIMDSGFGLTYSWLANMVDGSGKMGITVSWDGWDRTLASVAWEYRYGAEGDEFSPTGPEPSISLRLSLYGTTF